MAQTIFLTQDGLNSLKNELEPLKTVKRVEIAEKLKEAISFGDLSENSEYEDARNEQAQVELRISDIEEDLKNVEIIQESSDHDKVNMGSLVVIEDQENKESETYKIV
jgi:transcription elongation factor GreA